MQSCPCCSGKEYSDCCEPILKGVRYAETAEDLMRSRYSAYVKAEIDYIISTIMPKQRLKMDEKGIRKWSEKTNWEKLEIKSSTKGKKEDDFGTVEFIAHYREKGVRSKHHEIGKFKKFKNKWYYDDSDFPTQKQVVRSTPKVKRNAPCPCGSGKKYKKCCEKNT